MVGIFSCLIYYIFARNILFLYLLNVSVILILRLHTSELKHNSTSVILAAHELSGFLFLQKLPDMDRPLRTWSSVHPGNHQAHRHPSLHDLFTTRSTRSPAASQPPCLGHRTSFKMDHYTSSLTPP